MILGGSKTLAVPNPSTRESTKISGTADFLSVGDGSEDRQSSESAWQKLGSSQRAPRLAVAQVAGVAPRPKHPFFRLAAGVVRRRSLNAMLAFRPGGRYYLSACPACFSL